MKRPVVNDAGIEQQLQAADDMAYIDLVKCGSCGYEGDIATYEPAFGYADICCPKCKSTNNAHNKAWLNKMLAAMRESS